MILIVSKNNEITTTEIIKWLLRMGKRFVRVDEDELFEIKMLNGKFILQSERNNFFLDDITSVWYRRGGIKFKRFRYDNEAINTHMYEAQHWLEEYVLHLLESKKHINKQTKAHVNKLLILEAAKKAGLDVPNYFLSNTTQGIQLGKTIVKSITGNVILQNLTESTDGIMYTAVVDKKNSKDFFISFFQEKIEKDFEIRTFYLEEKIWSIAIFSQKDQQTQLDLRKYNTENPNRNVRYLLPKSVEEKICKLMKELDLNCGSIDFIKSGDKFYFLEVNVVGQFLSLSDTCNYSLDKEIADYL